MDYEGPFGEQVDETYLKEMPGFTAGAWDLLHTGHIIFLRKCREACSRLVVGLHVDPSKERMWSKNTPVQTVYERWEQLNACKYVDEIIPYQTEKDLEVILNNGNFCYRFLGTDYVTVSPESITAFKSVPIYYIDRTHNYSSSELRDRCVRASTNNQNAQSHDYSRTA